MVLLRVVHVDKISKARALLTYLFNVANSQIFYPYSTAITIRLL